MSAESSPLSSPPSSPGEMPEFLERSPSPLSSPSDNSPEPPSDMLPKGKKREPSPPHEEVLADNPDIALLVMFRARFSEAFPPKLINFGPQDIERGIVDALPSPQVEGLLCALLGLVLNRKKPVERGHYNRALEDALSSQRSQWPKEWNGINPISSTRNFNTMTPQERLSLLRALVMWSLHSSEAISNIIKESYKQNRHDDDMNQPLSVQPWGRDGEKRRYWLIEGRDDTPFRLYRESNPALKTKHTWWSVAGSIDELRDVATKLEQDGSQHAKRLSQKIINALPRFEATEEKRKRREYRIARKAQFARPEPGFSMYEGRTRGKRMKYTYSEDEDDYTSDGPEIRRSTRGLAVPGPTVTASGRQVRTRFGQLYGSTGENTTARESPASDAFERSDGSEEPHTANGRSTRSRGTLDHWANGRNHIAGYNEVDEMDEEDEAISSGEEWQGEDEMDDQLEDDDEDMSEATDEGLEPRSLIVRLRYKKQNPSELPRPSTPQKENKPDLAFRPTPTNNTFTPKVQEAQPMQNNGPLLPCTTLSPMNGYSNDRELSAEAGSADHQPQPILPSFSKFLYNPTSQTSATDALSSPHASSSLPTPPTTGQPSSFPNQHHQGW